MEIDSSKKEFLVNEFLMFSLNAGLQTRSYPVYLYYSNEGIQLKHDIKKYLIQYTQNFENTTEEDHYRKIVEMSDLISETYKKILINGRFRIGVSQKVMNLFLKYMWTAGYIKMPFHCPFDSIIKSKLIKDSNHTYLPDWTMLDSIEEYKKYVTMASIKAAKVNLTIAEWELVSWNRR